MKFKLIMQCFIFLSISSMAADNIQPNAFMHGDISDEWIELETDNYEKMIKGIKNATFLNKLEISSVIGLANALSSSTTLESLCLQDNQLDDDKIMILLKGLAKNSTIKTLGLHMNDIKSNGAKALANLILNKPQLSEIAISQTKIGDEGAWALAGALMKNTTLTSCYFIDNCVGPNGAQANSIIQMACKFNCTYPETVSKNIDILLLIKCLPEDIQKLLWDEFILIKKTHYIANWPLISSGSINTSN